MPQNSEKDVLHRYLRSGREALIWKLDGLGEYDIRRPLVPSGTNLLGLVKHLAGVEAGYFGATFGRPFPEELPWMDDEAEPNSDMWATPDESRESITHLYQRVADHSDATINALALNAAGDVAWWAAERRQVTLQQIVVHMIAETHRHAGHADIVRELIDGSVGMRKGTANIPGQDHDWWHRYRARLEGAARQVGDGS